MSTQSSRSNTFGLDDDTGLGWVFKGFSDTTPFTRFPIPELGTWCSRRNTPSSLLGSISVYTGLPVITYYELIRSNIPIWMFNCFSHFYKNNIQLRMVFRRWRLISDLLVHLSYLTNWLQLNGNKKLWGYECLPEYLWWRYHRLHVRHDPGYWPQGRVVPNTSVTGVT